MAASLATVAQLAVRVGPIADTARAQAALDDASAIIRSVAGEDWLTDAGVLETVPDVVVSVTLAVARRLYENPSGFTSETIGGYTYRRGESGGSLLLPHEARDVRKAAGRSPIISVPLRGYTT